MPDNAVLDGLLLGAAAGAVIAGGQDFANQIKHGASPTQALQHAEGAALDGAVKGALVGGLIGAVVEVVK